MFTCSRSLNKIDRESALGGGGGGGEEIHKHDASGAGASRFSWLIPIKLIES